MAGDGLLSIVELAHDVNRWCADHHIVPANGQAGEKITERNIRFYRGRGLLDAPGSESGEHKRGFSPKHVAQLRAIRLLQARSVPLEGIRAALADQTLEQLRELEAAELRRINDSTGALGPAPVSETWGMHAVGAEYLVISRRGHTITEDQRRQIAALLGVHAG